MQETVTCVYDVYADKKDLPAPLQTLLKHAEAATQKSYAPYSQFYVGAAALLENGEIVSAANQENASFPAGICAERVLLSTVAAMFPGISIQTIAVTFKNGMATFGQPITPCGICRQSLLEWEQRFQNPIQLVLGGMQQKVFVLPSVAQLLPLAFSGDGLK